MMSRIVRYRSRLGALLLSALLASVASSPVLANHRAALLQVPIAVTVAAPLGSAPVVNGDFVFHVACLGPAESSFGFFTPALKLTATQRAAPFAMPLTGTVVSANPATSTSGCTVTQVEAPIPPAGFFWVRPPEPARTGEVLVISDGVNVTAPTSLFENTLVAGIPIAFDIVPPGGGTILCDVNPVEPGTSARCIVTPAAGFKLPIPDTAVTGCAGTWRSSYYTDVIDNPCTITAKFTQYQFVVSTVTAPIPGGIVSCSLPAASNSVSTCNVETFPGYTLGKISGCGASGSAAQFVTAPVLANCTVTAEFSVNPVPTLANVSLLVTALLAALFGATRLARQAALTRRARRT